MASLKGTICALLFLIWTCILVPPYLLVFPLSRKLRRIMVGLWHRGACRLTGLKVQCHGIPFEGQRVLLAGNHISYLDIPVLASCLDVTFVAKADVAAWPFFGFLARIAQTAFIERRPSKARQQKIELKQRILAGERLMIFPEGTSSNGDQVLAFKSALFEMIMEDDLREHCHIQPVTIAFEREKDDTPMERARKDEFAWYGEMSLAPHLWNVFCQRGCIVDVTFHPATKVNDFSDRKAIAAWAHDEVQTGLEAIQTGVREPFMDDQPAPKPMEKA